MCSKDRLESDCHQDYFGGNPVPTTPTMKHCERRGAKMIRVVRLFPIELTFGQVKLGFDFRLCVPV
jgi:hypothetical protein